MTDNSSGSRRIQRLEEHVVNRIAAGEIIIAPNNALKELLENSIDAGSTSIDIVVKDGGIKLLQITDNGCGINKADLPILCNRHTTSKLQTFEDLSSIATYGFRGEALASISYISHLTVTTKVEEETTAWRTKYLQGEVTPAGAAPRAVAGKRGTQITVEDLFFNMPSRLRSLKNKNEEFVKILDVVGKYAIRSEGIAISCKRSGDTHPSLAIQKEMSVVDRIRAVYNSDIASELLEIEIPGDESIGFQGASGRITNANYSSKKSIPPILFINSRLVACEPLRKSLIQVYGTYLPKGRYPFIYLDIKINPHNVDVNVHPTKREVRFLYEDEIVEKISAITEETLRKVDSSRSYQTQSVLPGLSQTYIDTPTRQPTTSKQTPSKPYEYKMVRTDSRQQSLTSLFKAQQPSTPSRPQRLSQQEEEGDEEGQREGEQHPESEETSSSDKQKTPLSSAEPNLTLREFKPVKLASIKSLRSAVEASAHASLTKLFSEHTFVGIVDYFRRLAAVQHKVKLFLVDYAAISSELFYQIGLSEFSNFDTLGLADSGISVKELLTIAIDELPKEHNQPDDQAIQSMIAQLGSFAEMLQEYFNITLEPSSSNDGDLTLKTLPLFLRGYTPPMSKLPAFFYKLCTRVDWEDETQCLDQILRELSLFYIPESLPDDLPDDPDEAAEISRLQEETSEIVSDILFPAFQKRLIAPKALTDRVVEIANLPGLYRVFERC
ncbi:hypothetical protein TRICI_004332 [Trichomonascus ciferrii]|uniref:DNA mismatch repair protein S5 domain-containing protein n=1 Tax=Trichomonascus ciferrii TaxID=44093 RepID=A0A642V0K9_9ASCO|nr:hypothetical protein TRICI_004332 [Trichomonascus ciferrii]